MLTDDYYTAKYPPRGAWMISKKRYKIEPMEYTHGGYCSDKLKPCPVCGRYPVFEEYAYDPTPTGEKAKVFLGYCPTCELRIREPGTLKEAVMQWERREFSEDSWLHCHRPRFDQYGCGLLCKHVVESAIDDALFLLRERQELPEGCSREKDLTKRLNELEAFFRESVFVWDLDSDGIISELRRAIYPDLPPEERMKIPMHLSKFWKGKEVRKKWLLTQKMNSLQQHLNADMPGSEQSSSGSNKTRKKRTRSKT